MRDQCVTRLHLTDKNADELERRAVSRVASRAAIKTVQRLASHHEHIYMHALTFLTRKQTGLVSRTGTCSGPQAGPLPSPGHPCGVTPGRGCENQLRACARMHA